MVQIILCLPDFLPHICPARPPSRISLVALNFLSVMKNLSYWKTLVIVVIHILILAHTLYMHYFQHYRKYNSKKFSGRVIITPTFFPINPPLFSSYAG